MSKIVLIPIIGLLLLLFMSSLMPTGFGNSLSDSNIGLIDLNDGQTTYSGFAGKFLQVNATSTGWIFADANGGSGSGGGKSYTSGTPSTIEVNNDLNTISQNFDGNFTRRFDPAFDSNFQISFDGNYFPRTALLFPVPDNNILSAAIWHSDVNWQLINAVVPWSDSNVANNLTINTDQNIITDNNLTVHGYSITDQNHSVGGDVIVNRIISDLTNLTLTASGSVVIPGLGIVVDNIVSTGTFSTTDLIGMIINTSSWAFRVNGLGNTGLFFSNNSLDVILTNSPIFNFGVGGNTQGTFWSIVRTTDPTPDANEAGSGSYTRQRSDGNFLWCDFGFTQAFLPCASRIPTGFDFNAEDAGFNGDVNITGDIDIDQNLNVDGNIFGEVFGTTITALSSCTTACDGFDGTPQGSNWVCIAATSLAGVASTCADTSIAKNCMCQN